MLRIAGIAHLTILYLRCNRQVPLPEYKEPWLPHKVKQWLRAATDVGPRLGGERLVEFRELTATVDLEAEVRLVAAATNPHNGRV